MAILLNRVHPYFEILIPVDGTYRKFQGGKLEITDSDPAYQIVMAEAGSNPNIVVFESGAQCQRCGEIFTGKAAAAQLGKHKKDAHFEDWVADKQAETGEAIQQEVKARAGISCDACRPAQVFATDDQLQKHVKVVHLALPPMDAEGNELGRRDEEGSSISIPAAQPSK